MNKILKIKVCGMRDLQNIKEVAEARPDFLGLIFYKESKRFIGEKPNSEILKVIPNEITKTGVFVNETLDKVMQISTEWKLGAIQLHGNESPAFCKQVKESGKIILKAFSIDENFDFNMPGQYKESCDYYLFDTKGKLPGGTGQKFNWDLLKKYDLNIPFFLSGGISPDDMEKILEFNHPQFYGIDINSGFEISPGLKDVQKVTKFIKEIRNKDDIQISHINPSVIG